MKKSEQTKPHYHFDIWGMPLTTGDSKSWKDSIGRLLEMEYADNGLTRKVSALDSCLYMDGGIYRLKRHPSYDELSSRDHWSYFIQYMKNTRSDDEFDYFIDHVKPMRGMTLWFNALTGNTCAEWRFYTIYNFGAHIHNLLDWAITGIGNLGGEFSNEYWINHKPYLNLTRWQKLWRWIWVRVVPFYPVQNRAWQLKFLPDSPRKERQKRIYLKGTDKGNPIVRLLLGDTLVTWQEVDQYPEMAGDRSGVKLNLSCDRHIYKILNTENCYKRKLVKRLFDENT